MASNTRNVKLGVCKVYFDGDDLGYTKGGVEVSVSTETHKTTVDQFGNTIISEIIMGREVKATVPMAETTLRNLVRVMPGATLVQTGGALASGTLTVGTNPTTGQTVVVNGVTITFKTTGVVAANNDVLIGAASANTATALAAFLNTSTNPAFADIDAVAATAIVTLTAKYKGVDMNAFSLVAGTASITVSAATLTGGTDPTAQRVDVVVSTSTQLLDIAKELRLHPKANLDSDLSEDFIIPLAASAGAIQFAYKLDEERVFPVEFMGYPDPTTEKLFSIGDPAAA